MSVVSRHTFCVICAKPQELRQVAQIFSGEFTRIPGDRVLDHVFQIGVDATVLITSCSSMGHMSAAVRTAQVMSYHPAIIFFVGTAASLDPSEVQLGDVVVPRKSISRTYDKVSEEGQRDYTERKADADFQEYFFGKNALIPDTSTMDCSDEALSALAHLDLNDIALESGTLGEITVGGENYTLKAPRLHEDMDIFSCGMVVDSISYRKLIAALMKKVARKTTIIDMESHGFFRAIKAAADTAASPACSGIMIRGISDYAGRKSDTESRPEGWKDKSVRNAAIVTAKLIKKMMEVAKPS